MKKFFFAFALLSSLVVPLFAFALPFPYWGGDLLPCKGTECVDLCQLIKLGQNVIWLAVSLAVFAIAPVLIAWGGIMILISRGSTEILESGKKTVTSAAIGVGLVLASFLIVNTFFFLMGITVGGGHDWTNISCTAPELPPSSSAPPPSPTGGPSGPSLGTGWSGAEPPAGTLDDAAARAELEDAGIFINKDN